MRRTALSICIVASICRVAAAGEAPDLDAFAERLADSSLSYERAVGISALELSLDYGSLLLEEGIVVPTRVPGADRHFELVFVGRGRLRVEAPDEVEAQQLASFTGNDGIDAPIHRTVLVVGDDGLAGRLLGGGERSTFSLNVDGRPDRFEIDPSGQILADVQSELFEPKRYLLTIGEHLASLGRFDEAVQVLDRARQAGTIIREQDIRPHLTEETRELDARIHLSGARILLDRGDPAAARDELRAAERILDKDSDYYLGERTVLLARAELIRGRHALALETLNDYLSEHAVVLQHYRQDTLLDSSSLTSIKISRGEALALLAIASHEAGEIDSDLLVRTAGLAGVDMRALDRPGSGG